MILKITPTIICWEIWKQWCACKYGGQRYFHRNKMCYQAIGNIKVVLKRTLISFHGNNNWPEFCLENERLRLIQRIRQVTWQMPSVGTLKINSDGSYIHENGRDGIGGLVRNSHGDLLMTFSIPIYSSSSNMAEAMAAELGVKRCYQFGHTNFTLELDSMDLVNMLNNSGVTNVKLKLMIDSINNIQNKVQMQVRHCYREGNQVADFLAKMASNSNQTLITHSYNILPIQARGAFLLDKWQLPSVRCKYDRANFFVS
ncbi:uncharacterized protein LOC107877522 isoform X1 [Capsicum annuum]|uniref:uncharacterized protein LOC107877522 isoform X1 n=1 Tax=Capsicum annuum TaxID=4072 RepID=UPI001FB04E87|nr:uncharacterized protein LOC107877522 isoform X1 [Capsicum annuum]